MRRFMVLAVAAALTASAAACGSSSKSSSSGSATTVAGGGALASKLPADIQSSKLIKIGSDIEYAPIEFFKEGTQQAQGVDYDIAQALGGQLGTKITFVDDTDFAGIITALQAGRFDVVMSAMNDTAARRAKGVDFVDYFKAGSSILVAKGNPNNIKTLDDLCGHTVAVQQGTVQDTDILTPQIGKCKTAGKDLTVLKFEKDTDALQQVKNGRAVANVEDFPVASYNAQTSGGGNDFQVAGSQVGAVGTYGIAVPKSNTQLRDALQAALKAIIANGTYNQILQKWDVTAGADTSASINAGS